MKDTIVAFCTPDMNRPTARTAIRSLKATDLRRAELMVLDNAYADDFHHPAVMNEILTYAAGRPVIFADDDIVVEQRDWIDCLFAASDDSSAAIVGCTHTFPGGEPQHAAILVYADASTELLRALPGASQPFAYVPAVSSALVLVRNYEGRAASGSTPAGGRLAFDAAFEKYQHDVDICLSAWAGGKAVACATALTIVHVQADYTRRNAAFRDLLTRDAARLQAKWRSFAARELYDRAELSAYRPLASGVNWERCYNDASRMAGQDRQRAASLFRQLVDRCPHAWHRAGAHFHLYQLEARIEHLAACLRENPAHRKAADLLRILRNEDAA